jgi:hypothetical protein
MEDKVNQALLEFREILERNLASGYFTRIDQIERALKAMQILEECFMNKVEKKFN